MKKVWNVIKTVFTWMVVLIAVGMMIFTIVSVNTFDRTDRDLFGYKAFIVLSDSMSATDFSSGDLVLVKEVDPRQRMKTATPHSSLTAPPRTWTTRRWSPSRL